MNKNEFNEYCAKVMGLICTDKASDNGVWVIEKEKDGAACPDWYYNPYEDLNQMAEVVDKLILTRVLDVEPIGKMIEKHGMKQTFRDFIESTAQDNSNE